MTVLHHPFQFGFVFTSFSSLMTVARTSKTMLNKSGDNGYPCLVPDLRGNAFSFSPLNMMLAVCLSYVAFIMLKYVPSMSALWRVFIINRCWILLKAFPASIEMIIFLFFNLLMWYITLIDLQILKNSYRPGINPTWLWCVILFMYCWIWSSSTLLRIFASLI